ncbi:hypothetical protein GDO81_009740 [Engystomops pustulosus]|nr:hypothetical protein GDO81_009740 [Engystomops pustulosus]KAG8576004.1 hypothetical protein GDO81_009740 [Engystomops pustulosus]
MGILGTDYTLRSGHVIFLLLLVSSVLLGFNYLNEMSQRIQLQEMMERHTQRIEAERSIIQRKDTLLQTQIENRNKEMKRLKEIYDSQTEQQISMCEKERNNLLQTISSKEDAITEVKTQYESLKQSFEHLQSVMELFERNQSRLLEKFSTQSTQCMNVIHMLSELCNKRKIAIETNPKENADYRTIKHSNTLAKPTVSTLPASPSQESTESTEKHSTKISSTSSPTKDTTLNEDQAMQKLQELSEELNIQNRDEENEDEIMELEKILNSTEENDFKLQDEEGGIDDQKSDVKGLPKKTSSSQIKVTDEQVTRNKILTTLNKTSGSENKNKTGKVIYPQNFISRSENEVTNLNIRTEDKVDKGKSESKATDTGKLMQFLKLPQRPTVQKLTTVVQETNVAELEYDDNTEEVKKFFGMDEEEMNKLLKDF